jgi:electron transfer flavoprotein alpha subunit
MIIVIAEYKEGKFRKCSLEAISLGRRIAEKISKNLTVIVPGHKISNIDELIPYGAQKILILDNPILENYSSEAYSESIIQSIGNTPFFLMIIGGSVLGRDLAAYISAKLQVGLISDCTDIIIEDSNLKFIRPMYAGKIIAEVKLTSYPGVVSIRPNVFPASCVDNPKEPVIEKVEIDTSKIKFGARVIETLPSKEAKIELTEAEIIVSGGRGVKSAENFKIIEELAKELNAAVGASRAVVDAGWKPHEYQVGQTGKTVSPNVYIACGISGAIQHLAGMSSSKCIIAINKDPDAPIFKVCDFGVVGDLFQIIPPLIEGIRKAKS